MKNMFIEKNKFPNQKKFGSSNQDIKMLQSD